MDKTVAVTILFFITPGLIVANLNNQYDTFDGHGQSVQQQQDDVCPPSGLHYVAVPGDSSCSLYFICVDGSVVSLQQCPPGLLFSPELGQCDREENVDCGRPPPTTTTTTTTRTTTTTTTPSTTTSTTTSQPTTTTTTTTTPGPYPCPAGVEFIYMPHPVQCNLFYWCENGIFGGISNCGVNLWFAFNLQACVPPYESDCDKEPLPTTRGPFVL